MGMKKSISVVLPVFNEGENINSLYKELSAVLSGKFNSYEIIFVDDGSTDNSASVIKEIVNKDKAVKIIILRKNYGQTAAIVAGIEHAAGEFIVTMDADLQNDPKDITHLIDKMEEGYDLVSGWRKRRKDRFFVRYIPSIFANLLISLVTGLKLHDYGCTLKIYKRDFLKDITLYGEMHRFIPVYVYFMGGEVTEIVVKHRRREYGKSKYGMERIFKVLLDLVTVKFLLGNYSTSPLYFFGRWGFLLIGSGVFCGVITLVQKFAFGYWVHKNPLILLAIFLFILGTQAIFLGLLAELGMRIYYETTKKTIYTVKEKLNFST